MTPRLAAGRWDDNRILFDITEGGRAIACAVSAEALADSGPGHGARRWQLLEAFEKLRPRIERLAHEHYRAAPGAAGQVIVVSTADLNDPTPAAPAVALRQSAAA